MGRNDAARMVYVSAGQPASFTPDHAEGGDDIPDHGIIEII